MDALDRRLGGQYALINVSPLGTMSTMPYLHPWRRLRRSIRDSIPVALPFPRELAICGRAVALSHPVPT